MDWRDNLIASFKHVSYMSQAEAERLRPSDNTLLISITDPGREARLASGWKHLLRLQFEDLCPEELKSIGRTDLLKKTAFFTPSQAQHVIEAVDALPPEVTKIIVHCRRGRSRSVAMAQYLSERFKSGLDTRHMNPNPHVYKLLRTAGS